MVRASKLNAEEYGFRNAGRGCLSPAPEAGWVGSTHRSP